MSQQRNERFIYEITEGRLKWTLALDACQLVVDLFIQAKTYKKRLRETSEESHKKIEAQDIKYHFMMMIIYNQVLTIHSEPGNLQTF